jgi:hypothetical protein
VPLLPPLLLPLAQGKTEAAALWLLLTLVHLLLVKPPPVLPLLLLPPLLLLLPLPQGVTDQSHETAALWLLLTFLNLLAKPSSAAPQLLAQLPRSSGQLLCHPAPLLQSCTGPSSPLC